MCVCTGTSNQKSLNVHSNVLKQFDWQLSVTKLFFPCFTLEDAAEFKCFQCGSSVILYLNAVLLFVSHALELKTVQFVYTVFLGIAYLYFNMY